MPGAPRLLRIGKSHFRRFQQQPVGFAILGHAKGRAQFRGSPGIGAVIGQQRQLIDRFGIAGRHRALVEALGLGEVTMAGPIGPHAAQCLGIALRGCLLDELPTALLLFGEFAFRELCGFQFEQVVTLVEQHFGRRHGERRRRRQVCTAYRPCGQGDRGRGGGAHDPRRATALRCREPLTHAGLHRRRRSAPALVPRARAIPAKCDC